MVAPVPAQISKLPPCPSAAARRRSLPHYPPRTTHHAHHALPTLFLSPLPAVAGLCFHHFPNPFFCNPFIFTSLQIPRVWGICAHLSELCVSVPLWQIHLFQELAASLRLLHSFSSRRPLFSIGCSLFSQTTRGG